MKIQRYSCRCKLCKARFTTTVASHVKAFTSHGLTCQRFKDLMQLRLSESSRHTWDGEADQLRWYFEHRQIDGRFNADVKCDGRCMGATGHNCECSCGGANHGVNAAA